MPLSRLADGFEVLLRTAIGREYLTRASRRYVLERPRGAQNRYSTLRKVEGGLIVVAQRDARLHIPKREWTLGSIRENCICASTRGIMPSLSPSSARGLCLSMLRWRSTAAAEARARWSYRACRRLSELHLFPPPSLKTLSSRAERLSGGFVPAKNAVPNLLCRFGEPQQLAIFNVDDALLDEVVEIHGAAPKTLAD